jgi:hypothetical protein
MTRRVCVCSDSGEIKFGHVVGEQNEQFNHIIIVTLKKYKNNNFLKRNSIAIICGGVRRAPKIHPRFGFYDRFAQARRTQKPLCENNHEE